jgi:hypothetical protein
MHTRNLVLGIAISAILGTIAVSPAQAGSGLIKVTHSADYAKSLKATAATVAPSQPSAKRSTQAEFQVAVMATAPSNPASRRSVYIHR